ncbi:FecR domain-containing protein [filamentous cyanobacterium LEGE 11480]|uniref:FecR domain-containing protein n=2 Tax=Romeriopsis TaxID=2992131 RepID=A0A928VVB3_9CYAN|nr:FecR domain-containing protein [Romeriopsis navalis LEGE 11480]
MSKKALLFVTALLLSTSATFSGGAAHARRPIAWARVIKLVNTVRFKPAGAGWRFARKSDRLQRAGESLFTSRGSRAELRLSEGSLLRMSSNTHLWIQPNSRNLIQRSGTSLYVIRPGGGRTTIRTPYGRAGIRGSALAVRVNEQTSTMVVLALTNNPEGPMDVEAENGQKRSIEAGQMAVIKDGKVQLYEFDLNTFYQTSSLVQGLGLDGKSAVDADAALADPEVQKTLKAVQAETLPALLAQQPIAGDNVAINPTILQPSSRNLQPEDLVMQQASVGGIDPSSQQFENTAERQLANPRPVPPVSTAVPAVPTSPLVPPVTPPVPPPSVSPSVPPVVDTPVDRSPTDQPAVPPGQPSNPTLPTILPIDPPPTAGSLSPPVEQPVTPPVEQPVTPPVEQPITPPVEQPITPPVEQPVTPPVEQPVTPPVEPVPETPIEPPAEQPGDRGGTNTPSAPNPDPVITPPGDS